MRPVAIALLKYIPGGCQVSVVSVRDDEDAMYVANVALFDGNADICAVLTRKISAHELSAYVPVIAKCSAVDYIIARESDREYQ